MAQVHFERVGLARFGLLVIAVVMAAHGLVHLMGVALLWKLGEPGGLHYSDVAPSPGTAAGYVVGGLWLAAVLLFVAAAVLLIAGRSAWRPIALAGVAVSVPVIAVSPYLAVWGLIADGLVLLLVAVSWLRARRVPARLPGPG